MVLPVGVKMNMLTLGDLAPRAAFSRNLDHIRDHAELPPSRLIKIVAYCEVITGQGQPAPAQQHGVYTASCQSF